MPGVVTGAGTGDGAGRGAGAGVSTGSVGTGVVADWHFSVSPNGLIIF